MQEQLFDVRSAVATYSSLTTDRDTAASGLQVANAAHDRAAAALRRAAAKAPADVIASPLTTRTIAGSRPAGRLGIAAILLVVAIVAADALFLTRTRFVSAYSQETARDRHMRKKALRHDRRMPLNRARARTESGRVPAKPPDLPKEQ